MRDFFRGTIVRKLAARNPWSGNLLFDRKNGRNILSEAFRQKTMLRTSKKIRTSTTTTIPNERRGTPPVQDTYVPVLVYY